MICELSLQISSIMGQQTTTQKNLLRHEQQIKNGGAQTLVFLKVNK